MVQRALVSLNVVEPDATLARQRTWELLRCLSVITPRVEDPDTTESGIAAQLLHCSRAVHLFR